MTSDDIANRFVYHPPKTDYQKVRYEEIRSKGLHLASYLEAHCPPSRELSLAFTNLEQAIMWANAAIARHE